MHRRTFLQMALAAPAFVQRKPASRPAPAPRPPQWTQWGGPTRNFHVRADGIKDTWPAAGPRVVWKRALGDGYSSTLLEDGVVYTMYGRPREEVVLAADAETGATLWEHVTPRSFQSDAPRWATGRTPRRSSSAAASSRRFKIASKAQLLTELAWTPPVVVGTRAYLRDRRTMMAVDLG